MSVASSRGSVGAVVVVRAATSDVRIVVASAGESNETSKLATDRLNATTCGKPVTDEYAWEPARKSTQLHVG